MDKLLHLAQLRLKFIDVALLDFLAKQISFESIKVRKEVEVIHVIEVAALQKKFTLFLLTFMTSNSLNFVFKAARDALVFQIAWPMETSSSMDLKDTCVIFRVGGFFHRYCFSCMKQHVEVKLLNRMVARCQYEGCNSEVSVDNCEDSCILNWLRL